MPCAYGTSLLWGRTFSAMRNISGARPRLKFRYWCNFMITRSRGNAPAMSSAIFKVCRNIVRGPLVEEVHIALFAQACPSDSGARIGEIFGSAIGCARRFQQHPDHAGIGIGETVGRIGIRRRQARAPRAFRSPESRRQNRRSPPAWLHCQPLRRFQDNRF